MRGIVMTAVLLVAVIRCPAEEMGLAPGPPSPPVFLNLGQGVAWAGYIGRGERTGKFEDYPEYLKGCDIASFDIYPAGHKDSAVGGSLWYVAQGVSRLRRWSEDRKVIWNCIECTRIGNANAKPTPAQVRSTVWLSLIHGSRGLIYFVHQFKPMFVEAALLEDEEMLKAVTAINRQIRELAPVLNSPTVAEGVRFESSNSKTPVHAIVKRHGGATWLFAAALHGEGTTAEFRFAGIDNATAKVLGEHRSVPVAGGRLRDVFDGYGVHLYRITE